MNFATKTTLIISLIFGLQIPFNTYAAPNPTKMSLKHFADYPNLHVVDHPLIRHKLTLMRDKKTDSPQFRQLLNEIAMLMGYEVTRSLPTRDISIETPIAKMTGQQISNDIVIAPILRAGLGMADGMLKLIPDASIAHIGLYRDPETKKPVEYLFKTPEIKNQIFIVVDPMLATGNSAVYAVERLIKAGVSPKNILFMALVAAPEGIEEFQKKHPTIQVYAASLDEKLDDHAYIVPGLGDAGDRLYGTK